MISNEQIVPINIHNVSNYCQIERIFHRIERIRLGMTRLHFFTRLIFSHVAKFCMIHSRYAPEAR